MKETPKQAEQHDGQQGITAVHKSIEQAECHRNPGNGPLFALCSCLDRMFWNTIKKPKEAPQKW
ncbi:MAG: hypothetical protein AMXMBFR84_25710 [Candidatus Hydrogenedentota bacterium]